MQNYISAQHRHSSRQWNRKSNSCRLRKKSICCVALHLQSLQRTYKYSSFLKIRAPCICSFLLCRPIYDFLRDHQQLSQLGVSYLGKIFSIELEGGRFICHKEAFIGTARDIDIALIFGKEMAAKLFGAGIPDFARREKNG